MTDTDFVARGLRVDDQIVFPKGHVASLDFDAKLLAQFSRGGPALGHTRAR